MPSSALETLSPLLNTLSPSIVLTPEKDEYRKHSATFAAHKEKHPAVVLAPSTVDEVAKIVEFLYKTGLDFNVRGWGFKGATATDVLISMIRFDNFEYDVEKKVAQVGVGSGGLMWWRGWWRWILSIAVRSPPLRIRPNEADLQEFIWF